MSASIRNITQTLSTVASSTVFAGLAFYAIISAVSLLQDL